MWPQLACVPARGRPVAPVTSTAPASLRSRGQPDLGQDHAKGVKDPVDLRHGHVAQVPDAEDLALQARLTAGQDHLVLAGLPAEQ